MRIINLKLFLIVICLLLLLSTNSSASVSRQISLEVRDLDDIQLIKSRTYSGNETMIIRTQLDQQFGNSDGFLTQDEVDAFIASYNHYFAESQWIIFDESVIIKENATVIVKNLTGSTSDTSEIIDTTFQFKAKPLQISEGREHYFKFHRELWKYVDLQNAGQFTVDNNLTFVAPQDWQITFTRGLLNESLSNDNRTLRANVDLDFEWTTVKISTEIADEPVDGDKNQGILDLIGLPALAAIVILVLILVILGIVYRIRKIPKKADGTLVEGDVPQLSEEEIDKLVLEKKRLKEEILLIRRDLVEETMSKDLAKSKEKALKERQKEIALLLKSAIKSK